MVHRTSSIPFGELGAVPVYQDCVQLLCWRRSTGLCVLVELQLCEARLSWPCDKVNLALILVALACTACLTLGLEAGCLGLKLAAPEAASCMAILVAEAWQYLRHGLQTLQGVALQLRGSSLRAGTPSYQPAARKPCTLKELQHTFHKYT